MPPAFVLVDQGCAGFVCLRCSVSCAGRRWGVGGEGVWRDLMVWGGSAFGLHRLRYEHQALLDLVFVCVALHWITERLWFLSWVYQPLSCTRSQAAAFGFFVLSQVSLCRFDTAH